MITHCFDPVYIHLGAAVIFAQFQSVDQFRAIGWYNVAWGVALLILLIFTFRGESMQLQKN